MKVVHVIWKDPAHTHSGWLTKADFNDWLNEGIKPIDSVGMLAHETNDFIVLLQSVGNDNVADAVMISRSAIQEIRVIGEVEIELVLA